MAGGGAQGGKIQPAFEIGARSGIGVGFDREQERALLEERARGHSGIATHPQRGPERDGIAIGGNQRRRYCPLHRHHVAGSAIHPGPRCIQNAGGILIRAQHQVARPET